jgi:tripartite-type tricarboxylate transporter receptor subunit TctC
MRSLFLSVALTLSFAATALAQSESWPAKPVRVIVPYAPGSTPDTIARLIFERVQKSTGKTFVVENKPGAAGMIGADLVAKAAADGHTLVLAPAGPLATNSLLYKKMPYDPVKDLAPVALVAETPSILVASNAVAANDAATLLNAMASSKSSLAYASPGAGTLAHLNMAYLVSGAGNADIPHVAYAGSPQIVAALIANDVQIAALPPSAVLAHLNSGRIKAIATIGSRRSSVLPKVPTLRESGVDFAPVGWFGIATTAGTPAATLALMHESIAKALADNDLLETYRTQGLEVADLGPGPFAKYIAEENARWAPVIQRFRIQLD